MRKNASAKDLNFEARADSNLISGKKATKSDYHLLKEDANIAKCKTNQWNRLFYGFVLFEIRVS